ncbi:ribonuclease D [Rhodospirillaceae bacterium KN72]|uniref:Ribonuclease D n=1 Tax=Pacificispira spongiicola TaxID=2729598 RepID=A0A7Y0HF19_9PROT|nr:ribonuclease D [Pacificispira spongiicola]NMM44123.1 ribonuclease D [Pacificispira spongiicola]
MSKALISTTDALSEYCRSIADAPWVTVDTEFMRDKTYWPKLCLLQIAAPGDDTERAIDPLAEGIDLAPVFEIMRNPKQIKIFHAARQDLEIFYNLMGEVPAPIFDSQVAAMVCGFGDQVGYEALVKKICRAELDKSSRFTDWAHRPLTDRQITYALSDVTHLRDIYLFLSQRLAETDRSHWLEEEMSILSSADTYRNEPEDAWRRVKVRGGKPRFLQVVREVAAWREREAQARDIPRNRIIKDDSLLDIAGSAPKSLEDLARIRGLGRGFAEGKLGQGVLDAVERAMAVPKDDLPHPPKQEALPPGLGPMTDLLKVLLKRNSESAGVASRLIANADDLERIAADDSAAVPALSGWRRELFGEDALSLKHGKIALTGGDGGIDVIRKEG